MSHAHITVNDEVILDGEFAQIMVQPPEWLADVVAKMQPNSAQMPEPHMVAVMGTCGLALARQVDITIDVVTGPDWWTMTVKER